MLGPDEQFTQLSLSGGKPKKGNMIRSIALLLGPDFASDIIIVETGKPEKSLFSRVFDNFQPVVGVRFSF